MATRSSVMRGVMSKETQGAVDSAGRRGAVVVDSQFLETDSVASGAGALIFSVALFVVLFLVVQAAFFCAVGEMGFLSIALGLAAGFLGTSTFHVVPQWEKVVVLRLGKLNRVFGPGLVCTVPLIEHCSLYVDLRVRATPFGAKETLTADLIPLDVDAVLYWMVWDAEKAALEISNYSLAVQLAAQTALRDAIGRSTVAGITIRRVQLDQELTKVLEGKVSEWGITVLSVEIRDILVPEALQDAMSLEAQAEQRKKARIILMEGEQAIADMASEISEAYADNERALDIRRMHMVYESVRDTGGTVVLPSKMVDDMADDQVEDLVKLAENIK